MLDGQSILLYANIENSKDLAAVLQNDANGIGLFRSGSIYLERDGFPSFEVSTRIFRTSILLKAFKIGLFLLAEVLAKFFSMCYNDGVSGANFGGEFYGIFS